MSIARRFAKQLGIPAVAKKIFAKVSLELNELGYSEEVSKRNSYIDPNGIRTQIYHAEAGILHIGAHRGQEAESYFRAGTKVLWVEAMQDVFKELLVNIKPFPNQRAVLALLGDEEKTVEFHISNNDGESSSIHKFDQGHGPGIEMRSSSHISMKRLDSLVSPEEAASYAHWVVDVQGAELPVLIGAGSLIDSCFSLDVEVSTFNLYKGGTKFQDLDLFLRRKGFVPLWKPQKDSHQNLLYVRVRNQIH
jgi:FkbM family methyltransferase